MKEGIKFLYFDQIPTNTKEPCPSWL